MEERQREALRYFKERPVFEKLFRKFWGKYESLGHFGGKVTLSGLSPVEKAWLGGFFQKDYAGQKSVTISFAAMEKALQRSRFAGLSWEELLKAYFGSAPVGKKEEKARRKKERDGFLEAVIKEGEKGEGSAWLAGIWNEGGAGSRLLKRNYEENPEQLRRLLLSFLRSASRLPGTGGGRRELLPVFAARTAGDPHYYDEGTAGERLLTAFLKEKFPEREETLTEAERKNRLYGRAGVIRDGLSNDVLVYGLRAFDREKREHPGISGFWKMREPLRVTLQTLQGLSVMVPGKEGEGIWVVENPAVFSVLTSRFPDCAAICGNGQPRLALLSALDLFREPDRLYYSGDFDPEGLLIAQRLKERYGGKLTLWNYQEALYWDHLSGVELSPRRLEKLNGVTLPELSRVKEAMLRKRKAVYQEAMLEEFLDSVCFQERKRR